MDWWKKIKEKIKKNEDLSEITSSSFREIINGGILSKKAIKKQYPLLVLIAILTVFYIGNRIYSERQIAYIVRLEKELKKTKYKSLVISAELTEQGRRSYVLDYIDSKSLDLQESKTSPIYLEIPDNEK